MGADHVLTYNINSSEDVRGIQRGPRILRSEEEQVHSALRLNERTQKHQQLVKTVVTIMQNTSNIRCSDDAFDILSESTINDDIILIEAKTVQADALSQSQARIAVGQLLYYEYFDVPRRRERSSVIKVVAFDAEPGDDTRSFLQHCGIECLVCLETGILASDGIVRYFNIS